MCHLAFYEYPATGATQKLVDPHSPETVQSGVSLHDPLKGQALLPATGPTIRLQDHTHSSQPASDRRKVENIFTLQEAVADLVTVIKSHIATFNRSVPPVQLHYIFNNLRFMYVILLPYLENTSFARSSENLRLLLHIYYPFGELSGVMLSQDENPIWSPPTPYPHLLEDYQEVYISWYSPPIHGCYNHVVHPNHLPPRLSRPDVLFCPTLHDLESGVRLDGGDLLALGILKNLICTVAANPRTLVCCSVNYVNPQENNAPARQTDNSAVSTRGDPTISSPDSAQQVPQKPQVRQVRLFSHDLLKQKKNNTA